MSVELSLILFLLVVLLILQILFRPKKDTNGLEQIKGLAQSLQQIENNIKESSKDQRLEIQQQAQASRDEMRQMMSQFKIEISQQNTQFTTNITNLLTRFDGNLSGKMDSFSEKIENINIANRQEQARVLKEFTGDMKSMFNDLLKELASINQQTQDNLAKIGTTVEEKLNTLNELSNTNSEKQIERFDKTIKHFETSLEKRMELFGDLTKEKLNQIDKSQSELVKSTESKLDMIRNTVEEKLEKTLSERLGQSFETVGKQLIEVQKGLGEMQSIASDVGGLKKVLSNVKLRGGVGEVQLAMLLEQILAPAQYEANVKTRPGSVESVEFAIKLPGKDELSDTPVYLPIDAKFPKDIYEQLINAYENAIPDDIEPAIKNLENTIKKMAKDIREKYIEPPYTTDFAILFLPFEGIYAEVIRRNDLVDLIRNQYNIIIAGPTTLAALLNSLQMGFRTLAIQKRSSEVWKILGAVKTEFQKFGGMLAKAQKNIHTGLDQLDNVIGQRTKAIQRKLQNVEALPAAEAGKLIGNSTDLPAILEDEDPADLP